MFFWQNFFDKVTDSFKTKRYIHNHIEEMNIITVANKIDTSYDFHIKQNMHDREWKLFSMVKKKQKIGIFIY